MHKTFLYPRAFGVFFKVYSPNKARQYNVIDNGDAGLCYEHHPQGIVRVEMILVDGNGMGWFIRHGYDAEIDASYSSAPYNHYSIVKGEAVYPY